MYFNSEIHPDYLLLVAGIGFTEGVGDDVG